MVNGNNGPIRPNLEKFRISHEKNRKQRIDNFERLVNSQLKNKLQRMRVSPGEVQIPSGASISEENKALRKVLDARSRPATRPPVAPVTTPTPTPSTTGLPPISPPSAGRKGLIGAMKSVVQQDLGMLGGFARGFAREIPRAAINLIAMQSAAQPIYVEKGKTLTEAVREKLPGPLRWRPPEKPGEGTGRFLGEALTGGISYLPTEAEIREDPRGSLIRQGTVGAGYLLGPAGRVAAPIVRPILAPIGRAAAPILAPILAPIARAAKAHIQWAKTRRPKSAERGLDESKILETIGDEDAIKAAQKKVPKEELSIGDDRKYLGVTEKGMEVKIASARNLDKVWGRDLKKWSEALGSRKYLGTVARLIDPSSGAARGAAAETKLGFHLVEKSQRAEFNHHLARLKGAYYESVGKVKSRPIFDIEKGRVKVVRGGNEDGRVAYGDAFESPLKYFADGSELGARRVEFVQEASRLMDDIAKNYAEVSGVDIRTLLSGPQREHYWPRFMEQVNQKGRFKVKKFGGEASSVKDRIIDTMDQGLRAGIKYGNNPLADLEAYALGIQKMTKDELFKKRLLKKGVIEELVNTPLTARQKEIELFAKAEGVIYKTGPEYDKVIMEINKKANSFLSSVDKVGGVARFIATGTLDMAQFTLQMAVLLFSNPVGWTRAVKTGLRTFLDPESLYRTIRQNPRKWREFAKYDGDIGLQSELVEQAGVFSKIPLLGGYTRRFAASFNASLAAGRVEMFDAMSKTATKSLGKRGFKEGSEELTSELQRLARAVDSMLGTTEATGMADNQRALESGLLFFSPRYTRSVFGTLSHMFGTGATNWEVQKAMGKFMGGGISTYIGLASLHSLVTGSDLSDTLTVGLDPRSGKKFLSLPIGGTWVGIGGAYRSTAQLLTNLMAIEHLGLAKEGKPAWDFNKAGAGPWLEQAFFDNPITRYVRSRSSPVGGTLMDWLDGEDFIGRPFPGLEPTDWKNLGYYLLRRGRPFSAGAFIEAFNAPDPEDTPTTTKMGQAGLSFLAEALGGLRTSPMRWYELADDIAEQTFGRPYSGDDSIDPYQKREIEATPGIAKMKRETKSFGFWGEKQKLDLKSEKRLNDLERIVLSGVLSNWEIQQKYQDINNDYDTLLKKAIEDYGDPFEDDPEGVNAQDIKAYYAIYPNLKPGQTYTEGVRDFFRILLSKPDGSERYRYVVRNTNTRKLPMAILRALPRNSRERRAASDRERQRHRAGLERQRQTGGQ
jgi:hypothetical protein